MEKKQLFHGITTPHSHQQEFRNTLLREAKTRLSFWPINRSAQTLSFPETACIQFVPVARQASKT
jgi:hypothetical protein